MVSCGTPHGVALAGFALPRRVPGRPGSHRVPTRPAWGPHRSVLRWGTLVGHPCGRWSSTRKTTRALPDPVQGGGEDPRPAQTNQPLPPAGALARAHGPDLGQGEVAAVGLDPNHPGAEGAAVRGSALALAPRQADGPHEASFVGRPRPGDRRACPPESAASARRPASSIPLAKASLEGRPRSRLGGDPLAIWGHHPRPSLDPRTRPAWPGSSASGDRSTTAAPSMRRTRDRRRDRPWGSGPPSWRRSAAPLPPDDLPLLRGWVQGELECL